MPLFPLLLLLGLFGASRVAKKPAPTPVSYTPPAAGQPTSAAQPFAALAKASAANKAKQSAIARTPIDPADQAAVNAAVSQATRDQGVTPPPKAAAPAQAAPQKQGRTAYDTALLLAAFLKKTGRFGSKTDRPAEVALAQRDLGLEADGIVGPQTRMAAAKAGVMLPAKPKAATPAAAASGKRSPKDAATALLAFLQQTHRFGSKTDHPAETMAAQRDLGLAADGIVGPKTRAAAARLGVTLPTK
jgi:peptidoglycan hydrolase-like protein with peptidoglycan-binding domain